MRFVQGLYSVAFIALLGVSYHFMRTSLLFTTSIHKFWTNFSPFSLWYPNCSRKLRHRADNHLAGLSSALTISRTDLNASTVRAWLAWWMKSQARSTQRALDGTTVSLEANASAAPSAELSFQVWRLTRRVLPPTGLASQEACNTMASTVNPSRTCLAPVLHWPTASLVCTGSSLPSMSPATTGRLSTPSQELSRASTYSYLTQLTSPQTSLSTTRCAKLASSLTSSSPWPALTTHPSAITRLVTSVSSWSRALRHAKRWWSWGLRPFAPKKSPMNTKRLRLPKKKKKVMTALKTGMVITVTAPLISTLTRQPLQVPE